MSQTPRSEVFARLGGDPGLCRTCQHSELLASPRSVFLRCELAASDPRFPRYPPLPVVVCGGFSPGDSVERESPDA
ncbi:MAG: hypothetical protein ABI609_11390 [Acidobacteriota bacterium]